MGELTFEYFKQNLERHDVQMYLQIHGIDAQEAVELFQLLDVDESGTLSMDEFVYGCQRLKGSAKSLDMVRICDRVNTMDARLCSNQDNNNANYRAMANSMKEMFTEIQLMHNEMQQVQADMRPGD